MLSKMMLFILSIIADDPINPYAIIKILNHKRRSFQTPVHEQTVYSIINILKKKKLISGKRTRYGRRPDRTIYSITKKGETQLRRNLTSFIKDPEDQLTELGLFLVTLRALDKESALISLKEYQRKISIEIDVGTKRLLEEKKAGLPYFDTIIIEHIINTSKVNLNTVEAIVNYIENNDHCKLPAVPFWRSEIS